MAGSSAFQFGRAAYKAGLVNRRALARDAWENVLFRLRGSTDAGTDALRERICELLEGVRVRDLQRLAPDVLAGVLPRLYPRMLDDRLRAPGRRAADLHLHRRLAGDGRADGDRAHASTARSARSPRSSTATTPAARAARSPTARARRRRSASWPSARTSTSRRRGPTRDSESDLPMLRAVGHPVAVNPDSELARVAREEGWEVLRFDRLGRRAARRRGGGRGRRRHRLAGAAARSRA